MLKSGWCLPITFENIAIGLINFVIRNLSFVINVIRMNIIFINNDFKKNYENDLLITLILSLLLLLPLNAIDITTINVSCLLNLKLYHKPCLNVRCVAALK